MTYGSSRVPLAAGRPTLRSKGKRQAKGPWGARTVAGVAHSLPQFSVFVLAHSVQDIEPLGGKARKKDYYSTRKLVNLTPLAQCN